MAQKRKRLSHAEFYDLCGIMKTYPECDPMSKEELVESIQPMLPEELKGRVGQSTLRDALKTIGRADLLLSRGDARNSQHDRAVLTRVELLEHRWEALAAQVQEFDKALDQVSKLNIRVNNLNASVQELMGIVADLRGGVINDDYQR